jgi:hypothetical protein
MELESLGLKKSSGGEWSATAIAEVLLERSGRGLMSGDFELFSDCFILPQDFDTFEGRRRISSVDELRAVFDGVRAHFEATQVTIMERHVVAAEFVGDDEIRSTHVSRLVAGGKILRATYPVMSIIKLTAVGWKVASATYALPQDPGHEAALRVGVLPE